MSITCSTSADRLAAVGRRPRQTDLRRAVSNAYYAVFHCAAQGFADSLIGTRRRQTEAWRKVYRAIEHGKAKDEFKALRSSAPSRAVRAFAVTFVELQELRHAADYDPAPFRYSRRQINALITQARAAVSDLAALP